MFLHVVRHSRRLQVLDLLNRGCLTVLNLLLVYRALRAASPDSGGTQMCPMNDEQFLSALSAQEVEIELSKADEQDARTMTSWRLRKRHLMGANSNPYRYHIVRTTGLCTRIDLAWRKLRSMRRALANAAPADLIGGHVL